MTTILRTPTRRAAALALAATAVLGRVQRRQRQERRPRPRRRPRRRRPPRRTEATTTTAATTTTVAPTTTVPPPVYPLTGLPATDPRRRAPGPRREDRQPHGRRPQAGLNQADIVYEEIVEGITRFFTIFQSTDAGPVGPIRSARSTDVDLLDQLNRPLLRLVGRQPQRGAGDRRGERRSAWPTARAPASTATAGPERGHRAHPLQRGHGDHLQPGPARAGSRPAPLFSYRPAGTPSTAGQPVTTIDAGMNSVPVHWAWDAGAGPCGSAASTARPTSTRPVYRSTRPTSSSSSCPTGPARPTPARRRPSRSARATRGSSPTAS